MMARYRRVTERTYQLFAEEHPPFRSHIGRKEFQMKKAILTIATIGALASVIATAPAEARGRQAGRVAVGAAVAATAIAAGVAASTYAYGPGYGYYGPGYYEPGYVVYAAPRSYLRGLPY
jgi:hypothetical protein